MTEATEESRISLVNYKKQVYIGNLTYKATKQSLSAFVKPVGGEIVDVVIHSRQGKRRVSRRKNASGHQQRPQITYYGFITFGNASYAQEAVELLNQQVFDGRKVSVQLARPMQSEPPITRRSDSHSSSNKDNRELRVAQTEAEAEVKAMQVTESIPTTAPRIQPTVTKNGSLPEATKTQSIKDRKRKQHDKDASTVLSSTTVFVANLPYSATDDDLRDIMYPGYHIVSASVARMRNGRSKGYAFVEFASEEEQKKALSSVQNVVLGGRAVYAKPARQQSQMKGPKQKNNTEEPYIYYAFHEQRPYSDLIAFNTGF